MGLPTDLDGSYDHLSTTQNTQGGCGQERRVAVCMRNDQPLQSNSGWSAVESRSCHCHLLSLSSRPAEAQSLYSVQVKKTLLCRETYLCLNTMCCDV